MGSVELRDQTCLLIFGKFQAVWPSIAEADASAAVQ